LKRLRITAWVVCGALWLLELYEIAANPAWLPPRLDCALGTLTGALAIALVAWEVTRRTTGRMQACEARVSAAYDAFGYVFSEAGLQFPSPVDTGPGSYLSVVRDERESA
jgi:hypothetical protein